MAVKFEIGDRVRVKRGVSPHGGKPGSITDRDNDRYEVYLDLMGSYSTRHGKHYRADELEKLKEKKK